jgi:hypothetical protein
MSEAADIRLSGEEPPLRDMAADFQPLGAGLPLLTQVASFGFKFDSSRALFELCTSKNGQLVYSIVVLALSDITNPSAA